MIIEIFGKSGSGKSTVRDKLFTRLSAFSEREKETVIFSNYVFMFEGILGFLRNPWLVTTTYKIYKYTFKNNNYLSILKLLLKSKIIEKRIKNPKKNSEPVFILDQENIFFLYKNVKFLNNLIDKILLPDCVIELVTDTATIFKRRIKRLKDIPNDRKLYGNERIEKAKRMFCIVNKAFNRDGMELLKIWNQRFCVPPINEITLKLIFKENPETRSENVSSRNMALLKNSVVKKGVLWWTFENNDNVVVDDLVENITQLILIEIKVRPEPVTVIWRKKSGY